MNIKKSILLAVFFLVTVAIISAILAYFATNTKKTGFTYDEFIQKNPVFSKEEELSRQGKYRDLGLELNSALDTVTDPQELAYAKYVTARAFVNAVLTDNKDTESLNQALRLSKELLTSADYLNLKAYTVNTIDFLLYPSVSNDVKEAVMRDDFFKRFANGDDKIFAYQFRVNLLSWGNTLARMSDIKMKLAMIHSEVLVGMKKNSKISAEEFEKEKTVTLGLMNEAENSLRQDLAGAAPFRNMSYIVNPLYYKALTAQFYAEATGEVPYGTVDTLYQEAFEAADKYFPLSRPLIQKSYDAFLAKKK